MVFAQVAVRITDVAIPAVAVGLLVWVFVLLVLRHRKEAAASGAQAPRIHFIVLVLGTALYLLKYPGMLTIRDGVPEAKVVDIEALCRHTMLYAAFVVLVFGHALFRRLPPGRSDVKTEQGRSQS